MLAATVTGYGIALFIHVMAVVLALGPTFGYPIFIATAESGSPRSVPVVLRAIQRADRLLVSPGLIVILLAGIYLLIDRHISVGEAFVSVGFLAVLALFAMTHGFFRPNVARALELAERDLAAGERLSAEYTCLSRRIANGGKIAGAIIAIATFFMVVQP